MFVLPQSTIGAHLMARKQKSELDGLFRVARSEDILLFETPADPNKLVLAQIKEGQFLWQLPVTEDLLQNIAVVSAKFFTP
jgi:hypothetical protein